MARTHLLRKFMQLAFEHDQAERRAISPRQVREERRATARARDGLTRREFLGSLAATGIGAALSAPLLGGVARAAGSAPRIAVVGGGISGLNCALTLADAGIPATVFESKGRPGGRMFSDKSRSYWADGQVSEWCGELIDTGHTTIRKLCRRFDLRLDDLNAAEPAHSTETYFFGNTYYTDADRDFAAVRPTLEADLDAAGYPTNYNSYTQAGWDLDHMSVHDWIETRVPGGHQSNLGRLLDVAYVIEYGGDSTEQSALNIVYLLGFQPKKHGFAIFGESDERFHIRGGNQQLPEAIADALGPDAVRYGWRMRKIARTSGGAYALTFQTGRDRETVTADYVVLALPFAVLRTLDYGQAGFDALKNTAIQELGRSQNSKLMVQLDSRIWNQLGPWGVSNGTSFSDTGFQAGWEVSRAQPGASGIIVGYGGGSQVVSEYAKQKSPYTRASGDAQTAAYARRLLDQLEPVFPGVKALYGGKAELSIPPKDPDLNLAYSFWRVGQYTKFSGYEKAPQGNVFFAGEHCSQDFQGFMEGGADEGERAASEVLAAVSIAR